MKALLFCSRLKQDGPEILSRLQHFLHERKIEILGAHSLDILDNDPEAIFTLISKIRKNDSEAIVFSIGGDGSLLKLAHGLGLPLPPFVGINVGSLGFLAEIPVNTLEQEVDDIIDNRFTISSRLIIEGSISNRPQTPSTKPFFAINECTIHRGTNPTLIDIAVYIDDAYVNTFSCDGLITSTPSGSTAYSLSAGGPILTPDLNCLVITPICPHTISNKPIVLLPKKSLSFEYVRGSSPIEVSFDGQRSAQLLLGERVDIHVSSHQFRIVSSLRGSDYFHTLRTKLGWTGSLRH